MLTETIIQAINDLRDRKEFKKLTGVSKTIVEYLLSEVEEATRGNKLAVKKGFRRQKAIPLFEITFSYNSVYVSTIHKFGSARIKCIKYCEKNDIETVVKAIETVCAILNWSVDFNKDHTRQTESKMKIGYNIPEEANP